MDVRFLDVNTVPPEQLALWERWLAADKRRRLERLPEKARLLSLCGDGLAREMLARKLGIAPEELTFTYTASGKPLTQGAYFSISHSGTLVGCVVSDGEVGLDVEYIRDVPQRLGRALDGWQTPEDFWHLWTRREAAIKCRGGTLGQWRREDGEGLSFACPVVPQGYAAAVCEKNG